MSALTINGVAAPVLAGSWRVLAPERLGSGSGRGASGTSGAGTRAWKRGWRGSLVPLTPAEADAWRGLLTPGTGDKWTFEADPFYSSRLAAKTRESSSGTIAIGGTISPWGSYGFTSGWYYWPVPATAAWTIVARYCYNGSWAYGYVRRSDGRWFKGGAPYAPAAYEDMGALDYDAATSRLRVRARIKADGSGPHNLWAATTAYAIGDVVRNSLNSGNDLMFECVTPGTSGAAEPATWATTGRAVGNVISDGGGGLTWRSLGEWPTRLADLAFLPFSVPDSWVAAIEAEHDARPWTLPYLRASGSLLDGLTLTVSASVVGSAPVRHVVAGRREAGERVEFELREV